MFPPFSIEPFFYKIKSNSQIDANNKLLLKLTEVLQFFNLHFSLRILQNQCELRFFLRKQFHIQKRAVWVMSRGLCQRLCGKSARMLFSSRLVIGRPKESISGTPRLTICPSVGAAELITPKFFTPKPTVRRLF